MGLLQAEETLVRKTLVGQSEEIARPRIFRAFRSRSWRGVQDRSKGWRAVSSLGRNPYQGAKKRKTYFIF